MRDVGTDRYILLLGREVRVCKKNDTTTKYIGQKAPNTIIEAKHSEKIRTKKFIIIDEGTLMGILSIWGSSCKTAGRFKK